MLKRIAVVAVVVLAACVGNGGPEPKRQPPPNGGVGGGPGMFGEGGGAGFCGALGEGGAGGGANLGPQAVDNTPVVTLARPPPPISGGSMVALGDGSIAAGDADRDVLWLVGADQATVRRVDFSPGDEPGRVVEAPLGQVFVALRRGGSVAQVDVASGTVTNRYAVCAAPRGLAWVRDTSTLVVACETGTLARLGFDITDKLSRTSTALSRPVDDLRDVVAVSTDLYLTTFREARLYRVDASDTVSEIETMRTSGQFVPGTAWRMVVTPTGALVSHQWSSMATVATSQCGGPGYGGNAGNAFALVHAGLTELTGGSTVEQSAFFIDAPLPVDVAVSTRGVKAFASPVARTVAILDPDAQQTPPPLVGLGQPVAVAFHGETLVVFSREPALVSFVAVDAKIVTVALPAGSVLSTGHELFHTRTLSGLACASCHPEAGDDGRVWNLPEGPRRTPTLRGGLKGTAPFHWAGELPDMQSLMSDVMVNRMGGVPQSDARTNALLDWLDVQPARPAPDGLDGDAVLRGKGLFESARIGCSSCHQGAQFTTNSTVNVGTGASFQVPRLVELGSRAPYFHDGRIKRLEDRFRPEAGGDSHGLVSVLKPAEQADLVAYLRSL